MKKFYVYVHTCTVNGKKYVGCTTQARPERRWGKNGEGYLYNDHFRSAILKHGWNNFQHEVFEVDSAEEMYRKEIELISFYHSNDPEYGYNNSTGGEKSSLGCKHSEEYRKKMSESVKKSHSDPEVRRKMSLSHKGKPHPHSEEARKHMAEAQKKVQKKVHADPEYRKKLSESHRGKPRKPFSEEHKEHIAEAAKNRPRIKIKLPDGTIVEITKSNLTRHYVNKGKKFEYVS